MDHPGSSAAGGGATCWRRFMLGMAVAAAVAVAASSRAQAAVTFESFGAEAASTLAGAHADVSTSFVFRAVYARGAERPAGGDPRDIVVKLPPGLVGNLSNTPKCPRSLFDARASKEFGGEGGCPADTQVGIATIQFSGIGFVTFTPGVFNIEPGPNEPGLLGIETSPSVVLPIHLTASAHDGYALTATVSDVQVFPIEAHTLDVSVTLWGVPGAHERGTGESNWAIPNIIGGIPPDDASQWKPVMENPTDCAERPQTELLVNTYEEPEIFATATATSPDPTDCGGVPFAPSISVTPDTSQAGAPTGLGVDLSVPQSNDPNGRGSAELEKAVVTLPNGMTISPSAASSGLQGCTDAQFAAGSDSPAQCPAPSQIGEDEVETPLLPPQATGAEGKLTGKVYLGQPLSTNPTSGQMFRIFQDLRGFGLDVKLEGLVVANPQTGQLTATFSRLPELPFQHFRLHLNGGPNAVLVNPPTCGANVTATQLYPYSGNPPATPSSTFTTNLDGNGAPCPPSLPFSPSAAISTASSHAGALSPVTVTFARADETQPLGRIEAQLPAGLLGYVAKVALCEPPQALAGTCPAESRIGTVSTTAGAGSDPLTVEGSVYLAHGSDGYPFMLSVVVPAVAGPYSLGNVVVPVWLQVNSDGSLKAVSGPLPSILDGIPLDIRSATVNIDRPGFAFNPTSCDPLVMSGQITSLAGAVAPIYAPFQASGCGNLPFAPFLMVATQGSTSKANGASLTVRVAQKPGEANIHSVRVELPKQLPSRLTTLQKACTAGQFNSNPAGCPAGSDVGTAVAITPTLSSPLTGPAFLVSHGGAAFPDLEIVLQGQGVTVILDGATDIKHGITSSTFAAVPDVPISGFELTLPEGPYSALGSYGTPCASKLIMPTTIVGQNGVVVRQNTRIAVTSCPRVKVTSATVKGVSASLTVQAPAAGRLKISGWGLYEAARTLKQPGYFSVEVRLNRPGLAALRAHHVLKVKLEASFVPSFGSRSSASTTLVFR
jgi:hypothetical protein